MNPSSRPACHGRRPCRYARSHPAFRLGLAIFWDFTKAIPYPRVSGFIARSPNRSPEYVAPEVSLVRLALGAGPPVARMYAEHWPAVTLCHSDSPFLIQ